MPIAGTLETGRTMKKEKVALVTGAGSGIGRAVSLALEEAGYAIALAGRRAAQLEETAALGQNKAMLPCPTDVSLPEQVQALFARIEETFGRLDVLFNNAGALRPLFPWRSLASNNGMR